MCRAIAGVLYHLPWWRLAGFCCECYRGGLGKSGGLLCSAPPYTEAVIDKDFASQRLAELVEADLFIVLTGVDYVFVNYNKPDQEKLEHVNVAQLEEYIKQDQFAPGSMLPKVEAAIAFVNGRPEGKAVITSLENLGALIESESGTIIQKD